MPPEHGAGQHRRDLRRRRLEGRVDPIDGHSVGERPVAPFAALDNDRFACLRKMHGTHLGQAVDSGQPAFGGVERRLFEVTQPGWAEMVADHSERTAKGFIFVSAVHPLDRERVLPSPSVARTEIDEGAPHCVVRFGHDGVPIRQSKKGRMVCAAARSSDYRSVGSHS
jgi:hypothetical protein